MQLNEFIKKEGLENISLKTNISLENLENLQNEAFEKLNRVKSLGFINILEREYDIELEEIRAKIKEYFDDHHSAKDDEVVMLSPDRVEESGSGLFKWLVVFAILYALWYLYSNGKFDAFVSKNNNKETLLADHKALESNVTQAQADQVVVKVENKEEIISIDTEKKAPEEPATQEVIKAREAVDGEVVVESDITPSKEHANVEEETSISSGSSEQSTIQEPKASSSNQSSQINIEAVEANQSVKITNDNDEEEKAQIIYNLTVNPTRGMLWYGFINIDTKERREFMKKTSTPFELDGGRWILVTGHGYLEIVSDVSTVKVTKNIRNKHYFYLDSSEIKEIDRKEFRRLNGGRGW